MFPFPPAVTVPNVVVEFEANIPILFCPPLAVTAPVTVFVPP